MARYPEIDHPGARELYHDKVVMFRVKPGARVENWKGKFAVGIDSRWVRIDTTVQKPDNSSTVIQLPLNQEVVDSISPASNLLLQQFGKDIAFVIPQILALPAGCTDCRQAA